MYEASDHTFVVCAYKQNPYIEETICSLQNQTQRTNVILSTSTPNEYLEEICERRGIRMVVNPCPNLAGDDWNYGYDAAETPLVTMAHQDDYYEPTFVEHMVNAINQSGGVEVLIAFSDYYEIREGRHVADNAILKIKRIMNTPFRMPLLNGNRCVKRRVLSFGDSICCPAVTLVKERLGTSPFDTTYKNSCDYQTWVNLAGERGRFVYVPKRLMGHRIYAESATSKNLGEDIRKGEDLEILSTLWPRPIAALINRVYALSEKSNRL